MKIFTDIRGTPLSNILLLKGSKGSENLTEKGDIPALRVLNVSPCERTCPWGDTLQRAMIYIERRSRKTYWRQLYISRYFFSFCKKFYSSLSLSFFLISVTSHYYTSLCFYPFLSYEFFFFSSR